MPVTDPLVPTLASLFDSGAEGVIYFRAVRDAVDQIIDFDVAYHNPAAHSLVQNRYQLLPGPLLQQADHPIPSLNEHLFASLCQVLRTGQPVDAEHPGADQHERLFVHQSSVGDGVLGQFRVVADPKPPVPAKPVTEQPDERLIRILDGSANGIMAFRAVRDPHGQVIDFALLMTNEAGAKLANRPAPELTGERLQVLFPEAVASGLLAHCIRTTETGDPTQTEVYYARQQSDCWLDVSTRRVRDELVLTFGDISALKQAQQAAGQSTAELRAVINSAQVAISLMHPVYGPTGDLIDFRFRIANQMLATYIHQEPAALIGSLKSEWFPEYYTNGLFERYRRVYTSDQTQHFSLHYQARDLDAWVNITASRFGDDILVTFSDFTDLKRLQEQLEASATELQTIIDTSQTGIFLFSPVRDEQGGVVDFRFQVANQQLAAYVGQKPEAVTGALGSTWFPDYQTNGLFEAYRKAYLTGETQRFDFHYDGGDIDVWLDIMATKMGDEVLVTFGDYTPLKRMQQQLEASVKELQRSNENLEQFAYVASHDLQEPLRKILAFGDVIQHEYGNLLGSEGADLIQRMQSAASRMQLLIKDVLAYSRVTKKQETIRQVDLNAVVTDVLTDLETAIADRQAAVQVDPLPTLPGDPLQLRQLIQNLLSNALKFSRSPGTAPGHQTRISLTTRRVQGAHAGWPVSSADANRFFHCIEVTDNGIGFDPQQADRIFQVFQRLHGRGAYQGTGIGLAIVKKVVDNHQGYIRAEGRPGQGATFRVLLPE